MQLDALEPGSNSELPAIGTWLPEHHYYEPEHLIAIVAAWHAGRPLLVVGEPGVGKSQLARAVAHKLGWGFLPYIIRPGYQYQDLLWEFDAVARLAEAQVMAVHHERGQDPKSVLAKENFIQPGPLWWAYRPAGAATQALKTGCENPVLSAREGKPVVLLLDEIDKADADLPNGLLDVLSHSDLPLPVDGGDEERHDVLTIITSNGDRPLPPAFVRRCLVLNMQLPDESDGDKLSVYLEHICHSRGWVKTVGGGGKSNKTDIHNQCIALFIEARKNTPPSNRKPSVAEFLDLMRVVVGMGGTTKEQFTRADELKDLLLYKSL